LNICWTKEIMAENHFFVTDILRENAILILMVLRCETHWYFTAYREIIIHNEKTEIAHDITENAQRTNRKC
jgi:hypothetical protein